MTFSVSELFIDYRQLYVSASKLYETICIHTKRLVFDQAAFTKLYHELLVLQRSYILTNLCLNL